MSWPLFPIEIISHLARMMSLTIRLYANMLASDLLTLICLFASCRLALPVFPGAAFLVALIQALCLHAAVDDLSGDGGFARALKTVISD